MKKNTLQNIWQLFLICAFPFHFWAILTALQDIEWIIKRTNVTDALGVFSYALIFALVESIFVFLCTWITGATLLSRVEEKKRLAILSSLILLLSFLVMLAQLYDLQVWNVEQFVLAFFQRFTNSLTDIYIVTSLFMILIFVLPVMLIYQNEKILKSILEIFNRLSLLTIFYLFLDCFALIMIVFRNL